MKHDRGMPICALQAVKAVNDDQKQVLVNKVFAKYGCHPRGETFVLWGLAFKPNTDDMHDAPSCVIVQSLLRADARIHAHGPVAEEEARLVLALDLVDAPKLMAKLQFFDKPMQAAQGADALIMVTERNRGD